jgi:hypothetical protein
MKNIKFITKMFHKKGKNDEKTVTVFSFPHATKDQLDELLKGIGGFGKTSDDMIFTNTDLRDGSTVGVKIKGKRQ